MPIDFTVSIPINQLISMRAPVRVTLLCIISVQCGGYKGTKERRCFASNKWFAELLGCEIQTIQNALVALSKSGDIKITHEGRRRFIFPTFHGNPFDLNSPTETNLEKGTVTESQEGTVRKTEENETNKNELVSDSDQLEFIGETNKNELVSTIYRSLNKEIKKEEGPSAKTSQENSLFDDYKKFKTSEPPQHLKGVFLEVYNRRKDAMTFELFQDLENTSKFYLDNISTLRNKRRPTPRRHIQGVAGLNPPPHVKARTA